MSSIYDALSKVQSEKKLDGEDLFERKKGPSRGVVAAVICVALLSSVVTGGVFWFVTDEDQAPEPAVACVEPSAEQLLMRAKNERAEGRDQRAIELFEDAIKLDAGIKEGYIELGSIYFASGRYDKALETYTRAQRYFSNDALVLNNMGSVLLARGDAQGAVGYFTRAHRSSPDYVEPVYNLACAYAKKGEVVTALDSLEKAVSMNPEARKWAAEDPDLASLRLAPGFGSVGGGELSTRGRDE